MNENGATTVVVSALGAIGTAAPIVVGTILTTDNVGNTLTFIVALLVSLLAIGTGIGKLFEKWKMQIAATIRRDELLADLCERVQRIEERQVRLLHRFEEDEH